MVSNKAFILHMCIPGCKTFSLIPRSRLFVKVTCLKMAVTPAVVFQIHCFLPFQGWMLSFLAPLAVGQQVYVMAHCVSIRACLSVRALTISLNIFSETTYRILMKFHRNVPAMVLFRIS